MSANAKIFEAREHCKAAERAAKTSMFRWKADYDSAADEYSQAAQCFRIARDLPNSKECHLKASECYKRNNAFFHAAKALENAIIVCKEIAPAEEIYNLAVESASLYQQHGSGDSGAGVLDKAAKILEDKDLDLAVKLFQQAADVSSGNAFEPTAMQINHLLNYIATPLMDSSRNLTVKQLNEWEALKDTLNDLWGPPKTIEEWIEIMAELKIQEGFVRNRGVVATSSIQEVLTVSEDEQAQEIINGPEDEQIEEIIRFPEDECIEEIIRALGDEQAQEIVRVPMDKQAKGIIKVSEEERVRNIKGAPDGDPEQDIIWAPDNDESHEIVRTPNDLPAQIQEVLGTTNDHPAQIPEVIRDNDCLEVIDSEAQEVITFSDDEEPQEVRFPQVPKPLVFLEEPNSDEGVPRSPENSDDEDDSSSIEIVHDNSTAARTSHPLFCMRNPSARHYALTSMEQPHASTATEQPHAATTMEQPHASSTNESTPTEPPHAPTATERPHTATATEQPHESTATEQPHASSHNESTPTEQPHESTATEQPHASSSNESTATEQPHASTATEQPHESDATEQPHALTSSEQPQTSTSASTATKQPHASTSTEQLQTSTSASTATEKPSVSTSTEQPRASTSTEHPRASTSYASISMEQAHASTSYASTSIEQPRASTSYASTSRQQPYASTSYASTSREQSYASTSYASTSYASDWMEHPQPSTSYASTSYASDWLEHPQASTSYASTYASDWMEHPQPSTSYAATSKEYTYARVTSARQIQTAAAESSKMLDPMQGTYGMSRKRRAELMQHSKSKLAKKMHKDKIKSSLKKMYKQLKAQALEETREDPPIPDKNIFGSDPDENRSQNPLNGQQNVMTESSQHQGSEYISKASRILVKLQRYDQAVDSLRREIGFHQESGNIGAIGRLTVAIVLVQLARGDTVAAEKAYKEWGSNCEVAEMQTLEQILQAYDEEDRESAKRALASPFIRNMDVEYARLAASVPLPEAMEPAPRATVVENAAPSYVSPNASSTTTAEISHVELEESPYAPVTYAKKADDDDGLC